MARRDFADLSDRELCDVVLRSSRGDHPAAREWERRHPGMPASDFASIGDRWAAESAGRPRVLTPEELDAEMRKPGSIDLRPQNERLRDGRLARIRARLRRR